METYNGHVRTPADAIILFEACRMGLLPRVQRRLSEKERQSIKSGSVFVWDEREAGMRRWTDGKSWSASRVSGSFLTYREMEGKRGGNSFDKNANRDGMQQSNDPDSDGGPDGYRYKPDGLMKQSFSIITNGGQKLHLISYFSRSSAMAQNLMQPSADPQLRHIRPEKGMYPEASVHEQSAIPAVTRGPMNSPGYTHAPHQPGRYGSQYAYAHPGAWAPPSPMHTPPPHPHYSPYYPTHGAHPGAYQGHGMQYAPQQQYGQPPPPMTALDRPPPYLSNPNLPPPPGQQYNHMPPMQQNGYAHPYGTYQNGYSAYHPPPVQGPPPGYPTQYQQPAPYNPPPPTEQAPAQAPQAAARDERPETSQSQGTQTAPLLLPLHGIRTSTGTNTNEQQAQQGVQAPVPGRTSPPPAASGQTIPSISAMLNGGENGAPPVRSNSRSPNGTARVPSDIPSHKLGFEANRDMQALRNLDKTTFKAY